MSHTPFNEEARIKEQLRGWIVQKTERIAAADLTDKLPLLDKGILRSIHVPELLRFVEELRGRALEVSEIRPGVFRDIDTIFSSFFTPAAKPVGAPPRRELDVYENGQVALSGQLLALYQRLDETFVAWAREEGASEHLFPPIVPARELEKIGYLSHFAHLATFPVALAPDEANIARLAGEERDPNDLHLPQLAKVKNVLTPAACYHVYIHLQRQSLPEPRYLTTRATCFRREAAYDPPERLWSFSMREIVYVGRADEVADFLSRYRTKVSEFADKLGLPTAWANATDPFFRPAQSAEHLAQRLDPVKQELIFDGRLSLGSTNLHRSHFGEAFEITIDGKPAWTGCVAFGLERWLAAITATSGADPRDWPAALRPLPRFSCSS